MFHKPEFGAKFFRNSTIKNNIVTKSSFARGLESDRRSRVKTPDMMCNSRSFKLDSDR